MVSKSEFVTKILTHSKSWINMEIHEKKKKVRDHIRHSLEILVAKATVV
jgi:hypothetical protein